MFRQVLTLGSCIFLVINSLANARDLPRLRNSKSVRIDAAFVENNVLFLFSGDEFVSLKNHDQESSPHPRSIFSLPDDFYLLAAYKDDSTDTFHFFGPNSIASINAHMLGEGIAPSLSSYKGFPFEFGPDAAMRDVGGRVFFHKGCSIYEYNGHGGFRPRPREMKGLPCDIDASWQEDLNDVILKGDQIWVLSYEGLDGPFQFHDIYNLQSWTLRSAC